MLARQLRRQRLGHERAARGGVAIDRNRDADPRPAERDAAFGAAFGDGLAKRVAVIGIIDAVGAVGAEILDFVAGFETPVGESGFQLPGGVVRGYCNAHYGAPAGLTGIDERAFVDAPRTDPTRG